MPVPRRRHCQSRQGKGRAHIKLVATQLIPCESCGAPKRRHRVCPSCGSYKKREVIKLQPQPE